MFNESIVPLLYYVYLINPQFKLYCFFFFGFFFGGGGFHIVPISQDRGRCVSLRFPVKSEWNILDIDIVHESDYLEFLHKIMGVIRCQKSRHAVMYNLIKTRTLCRCIIYNIHFAVVSFSCVLTLEQNGTIYENTHVVCVSRHCQ